MDTAPSVPAGGRMGDWRVELVRATLFPAPANSVPLTGGVWEALTGSPPDVQSASLKQGLHQEHGPFLGGGLSVDLRPDRIDVWLAPLAGAPDVALPFEALGGFDDAVQPFLSLVEGWFPQNGPPTRRVAFGMVLSLPVSTRGEGYRLLGDYLPFRPDPSSFDLLYQINRKRPSKTVQGADLNRVTKWSVGQIEHYSLSNGSAAMLGVLSVACRLEVDFSTPADRQDPISKELVCPQLREFGDLARETLQRGDVP